MLEYQIENILNHINNSSFNTIEIPESINLSYGKVKVLIANQEKSINCTIKNGNSLQLSLNILNKIFDDSLKQTIIIIIDLNNLNLIESIPLIHEIVLHSVWNSNLPTDFDFSHSIYVYFSSIKTCYICPNDLLKIPIDFYNSTELFQRYNLEFILQKYIFVKVISMKPIGDSIFEFNYEKTRMIYESKNLVVEKSFNIENGFERFSDELGSLLGEVGPVLRARSWTPLSRWIGAPLVHIRGPASSGKRFLVSSFCQTVGFQLVSLTLADFSSSSRSIIEKAFNRLKSLFKSGDFLAFHFRNFDKFFQPNFDLSLNQSEFNHRSVKLFVEFLEEISVSVCGNKSVVVFLSTIDNHVPRDIDQRIVVRYCVGCPTERDRLAIIRDFIGSEIDINDQILKLSSKIPIGELVSILRSIGVDCNRSEKSVVDLFKSSVTGGSNEAAVSLETVTWRDIGGQQRVIEEILTIVQLTLSQHKSVPGYKVKKSGILLYGEPGTGKTLIAKAVAHECALNFISVKGPELLNMYVGQTEENVRSLFSKVRHMTPCLLFCDELDSLIPRRGFSGDSGGVMDRVVSQFAVEIDSINNEDDMRVIIIGATNRPDLIDPALLRNGRFDKIYNITGGVDKLSQLEILKSQIYKLNLDRDVNLEEIINQLPVGVWTGAQIYGVVSTAVMNAIRRTIELVENNKRDLNCELIINMSDFIQAIVDSETK